MNKNSYQPLFDYPMQIIKNKLNIDIRISLFSSIAKLRITYKNIRLQYTC